MQHTLAEDDNVFKERIFFLLGLDNRGVSYYIYLVTGEIIGVNHGKPWKSFPEFTGNVVPEKTNGVHELCQAVDLQVEVL